MLSLSVRQTQAWRSFPKRFVNSKIACSKFALILSPLYDVSWHLNSSVAFDRTQPDTR